MSSGSKKSGSPPKPPGPNATKEETLKYLLRPIELLHGTRVNVMKPLKLVKIMPLKATEALKKMPTIKEASSQDGKVVQDKHEDTKHLPSASK